MVWHPSDDILASASYDNTIKLFKEDPADNDWICFATLQGHESTVWSLSWNKDGTKIVSCSDDGSLKIWKEYLPGNIEGIVATDGATWKCICTISGYHNRTVYDVSWSHLNDLIATACGDDSIRIFKEDEACDSNAPTFSQIICIDKAHAQDVNTIEWNPVDADLLLSGSDDGDIKLWKLSD